MKYYLLPIILIFTWALSSCSDSNDALKLELELEDRISSKRLLKQIHLATLRFKDTKGELPITIDDLLNHKDATFKGWYELDFNRLTKNGHTIAFSYSPENLKTSDVLCNINVNGVLAFEISGNGNLME